MTATHSSEKSKHTETLESRRLAEILVRLRGDWMLSGLVDLLTTGDFSANIPLGLVVDGVVFTGYLVPTSSSAQQLDDRLVGWVESASLNVNDPSSDSDTVKETITRALRDGFTAQSAAREEKDLLIGSKVSAIWATGGDGGPDRRTFDDVPDDLVKDVVDYLAPPAAFSLNDAKMQLPSGVWAPVGLVRILISHVGAWWVVNEKLVSGD